jgi:hypothetical protein
MQIITILTRPQNPHFDAQIGVMCLADVISRQITLGHMANTVDDHFVAADLKDRSMRGFVAKAEMKLSNDNVERIALSGNRAALGIFSQRSESLFKSFEPAICLFRRAMLRPPKSLLQELAFGARQDRHAVIHSLGLNC